MQILEHEHERPLLGEGLEKAAPGGYALRRPGRLFLRNSGERAQVPLEPLTLRGVGAELGDGADELLLGLLGRVVLEDARLCLDDLGQRPEGHSLAVGKRPALAPRDEFGVLLDRSEQLEDEPALADPGDADDCDQLGRALLADTPKSRDE